MTDWSSQPKRMLQKECREIAIRELLADQNKEELQKLAIEIADSAAMSDLESFCTTVEVFNGDDDGTLGRWWRIDSGEEDWQNNAIRRAARYLEIQGKVERCPGMPTLVRKVASR
jgi:hypothetical protein